MEKVEKIEDLYKGKFLSVPEDIRSDLGHFNVFRVEPFSKAVPYRRRDYYKITLVIGNSKVLYADKVIDVRDHALIFSNPLIPYKWENIENITGGYFCIFNQDFFHGHGNLNQYEVFQPNGTHVFDLAKDQVSELTVVYERMFKELESGYIHKYDVLRNQVHELLHYAMKMQPNTRIDKQPLNASQRISMLFLELLERQFPIDDTNQKVMLRTASDFANNLNVHINHLNRSVKDITQKTTTEIISERILLESKTLLKQTTWSVSEVAFSLAFSEVTHFNNFFKKHVGLSPMKFRNI